MEPSSLASSSLLVSEGAPNVLTTWCRGGYARHALALALKGTLQLQRPQPCRRAEEYNHTYCLITELVFGRKAL